MSLVPAASANLDENYDDNLRGPLKTKQNSHKMFNIGRELCFLLLIVFTTYASLNSHINLGSGPPPVPFFPRGSIVGDFYKGELSHALLRASEGDVTFIMYYAPWDAESQATRKHFEAVALRHYKQVYFAGINCWQPRSECKRTLSKIQQFPKLVVYLTHETGVEYRGPRNQQYMSAFLDGVMRPLHRLLSPVDLARLRNTYNAVVVAYLNFYGVRGGRPYRALYETALKFLERNSRQEVAFAVVTSFKTAVEFGANRTPCIKMYLWNETLDYGGHFGTDQLSEWVTNRLHQVSLWLSPPGIKSLTLAPYVTQGPALLMFTPLDNFVMYDLLREVGMEYYNCNNSTDVSFLSSNISAHVSERIWSIQRSLLSCQSEAHDWMPTTIQILNNVWTNVSCGKQRPLPNSRKQCYKHEAHCNSPLHERLTSMLSPDQDPLSAPRLTQWARQEHCRQLNTPPAHLAPTPLHEGLRGLACRFNWSISLLALDSTLFSHLARGLGVDPDTTKYRTKVVLLNSQMETTHLLNEPVTRASLSQFLVNFTESKLERFQRSQPPPSNDNIGPPPPSTTVSVMELTTDSFIPVVFNESLNVVVLYYTPYCAFCHAISHVYLTAARLLHTVPSVLFTRIDGEANDLPWQYTAPHYPSILFFPARRKAESRVLTSRVQITVDSLTRFVLANLPLDLRLLAMIQMCQRFPDKQWSMRRKECLVDVRREVLQAISTYLTRYRTVSLYMEASREKRTALGRVLTWLQHLKQLQFSLSVDSNKVSHLTKHFLSPFVEEHSRVRSEL